MTEPMDDEEDFYGQGSIVHDSSQDPLPNAEPAAISGECQPQDSTERPLNVGDSYETDISGQEPATGSDPGVAAPESSNVEQGVSQGNGVSPHNASSAQDDTSGLRGTTQQHPPLARPEMAPEQSGDRASSTYSSSQAQSLGKGQTNGHVQPATDAPDDGESALNLVTNGLTAQIVPDSAGQDEREYETDSSPYESSSDDSSEDSDDDYPLMDPREQALLLMQDAGSDDEGGKKGSGPGGPRTQNEQIDEIVEMPDLEITPEMKIELLGSVQVVVDNVALIKAQTTGEYQVLETSSALCLEDRKLIGVVAETIGRVEEPMYVVRFTNPATVRELGVEVDKPIFYVPSHSHFLFTKALQIKGSDASNLHDEEVGANEVDFSDDEAEAAYKASLKKQKQAKREARGGSNSAAGRSQLRSPPTRDGAVADTSGPMELSYDDGAPSEDLYTPLARPTNLASMMRQVAPTEERVLAGRPAGHHWRGGDFSRGRGRGDRGRGRGRGDHAGRGRGPGFSNKQPNHHRNQEPSGPRSPVRSPPPVLPQQFVQTPQPQQFQAPSQFSQQQQPPPLLPPSQFQAAGGPQTGFAYPHGSSYSNTQPQWPQNQQVPPPFNGPMPPQFNNQLPPQFNGQLAHQIGQTQMPPGAYVNPMFFAMAQQGGSQSSQYPYYPNAGQGGQGNM